MNFKSIFWLFNLIVFFSLILFILAAFVLFGSDSVAYYFSNVWLFVTFFLILFGILDYYFITNWKLFAFMEEQDWPALLAWLENNIYNKKKMNRVYANLLINTALSVSNYEAVKKLEIEIRQRRPKLLRNLGVALGIPILLEQNQAAILTYFEPLVKDSKTLRRDWARWCWASAAGEAGYEDLFALLSEKDLSVHILALAILSQQFDDLDEGQRQRIDKEKVDLQPLLKDSKGKEKLQKSRDNHLLASILSTQVDEARSNLLTS